jgi:cytochrome c-type biogenesis protein CcmH/NrfF
LKNEKLMKALELMASGLTAYAAAKQSGCPKGTLYTHLERERSNALKGKVRCPHCNSLVDSKALKS